MAKKITATLPKGTLVFPKLNKVDDFKGKRTFKTRIKFDDENHRKVDAWLKKAAKELGQADAKLPWYKDKKTGELTLKASSGEKYPPALLDAKGREVPRAKVEVGGGTIAKVDVTAAYYEGFGGGINLYMNFVQIIELQKRGFNVQEEEGFSYEDDDGADEGVTGSLPSNDLDDDIPFAPCM
ncbi:hypothetical protein J2R95_003147 [Bradyrhizobium japonicum]|uniref:hypothetical protein n=1 Tax=Bradyrhizobium japonicum TaxID=375 RepID=UPI00209D0675|nr:hypothetical protein [Bradyrhizobium japonicum]MCP1937352.1 hypothetical protein [Bradyrhizobium japonicum]